MTLDEAIGLLVPAIWLSWVLYWWVSARNVKRTRWREPVASQLLHRLPLILAFMLMLAPRWVPSLLTRRYLPASPVFPVAGTVLLAAGLGFSVWARRHLGPNWSANVVVKEDHALVRSGPYRHIRHPIYTGLLLALAGMAVTVGEWRGIVGVLLGFIAFVRKSGEEEKRMRETFPEYEQYRRETAALIPFVY